MVFLGEQHDNAEHHARQAQLVKQIAPKALVFEMLTNTQAARITPELVADETALEAALDWNASGWPDFAMYYPIFAAGPEAVWYGAGLPRDAAQQVMSEGATVVFGPEAPDYGLDQELTADQQGAREALQKTAHCDMMPEEMLPVMVEIQRVRDAMLASAAAQALEDTGGPVVVITGNGHARRDWGAPALLALAHPGISLATFGQGEESFGAPDGGFDVIEVTGDVDRGDPCAAFQDGRPQTDGGDD
ncbi:Haem-binding uptake, Tiki superfamily, ChaN [Puniceibacterium sediminis]|uniref:Haem-binding uptake, Tiki superfamily, ChaN n=1 Tax=Puniceibacterium sediminis TaxID=1608407 RepID=A0A238WMF2_9RHOB|nr:Haem-binding uptake, Tiki superfamily, ChaN [Puniceibacterium sediminis]